jgi:hypothetical protein
MGHGGAGAAPKYEDSFHLSQETQHLGEGLRFGNRSNHPLLLFSKLFKTRISADGHKKKFLAGEKSRRA